MTLHMECEDEELSEVQIAHHKKAAEEFSRVWRQLKDIQVKRKAN